jgi:hypothetical protein
LLVGESDDQTVLGRLVFVLVLANKSLALTVIRFSFAATSELDLISREVRFGFGGLDERLLKRKTRYFVS